jgi:predicted nucleic acid-binding protein
MKKVFVDTDVVLDLLLEREPFWQQSAALFTLAHRRAVSVHLSAVTFSTLYYFLRKYKGAAQARAKLSGLRSIVTVLPTDVMIVDQAIASRFADFEDAVQYYTALGSDMDVLVTRNTSDFKQAELPVNTPDAFLKTFTDR